MRLLDVGCGPGSITAGLAKRAEPAETIGIDPSPSVIETARSLAEAKAGGHLTFEVGNIYEPRFAPETFEAVFAHHSETIIFVRPSNQHSEVMSWGVRWDFDFGCIDAICPESQTSCCRSMDWLSCSRLLLASASGLQTGIESQDAWRLLDSQARIQCRSR
jgi:hypothetical protein